MNTFFSTVNLSSESLRIHNSIVNFQFLNKWDSGSIFLAVSGSLNNKNSIFNKDEKYFAQSNNSFCTCSGYLGQNITEVVNYSHFLLQEFYENQKYGALWHREMSKFSCALYDTYLNNVWLISDIVGSIPIWYSFIDAKYSINKINNLIVTSDFIGAHRLGFNKLTSLGPGQVMSIDVATNQINTLYDWHKEILQLDNDLVTKTIPHAYAKSLLVSLFDSLISFDHNFIDSKHNTDDNNNDNYNNYKNKNKVEYFSELDEVDSSSLLLDCAANALQINRKIRKTRPLVQDKVVIYEVFNLIMG
jgi:hypothetical protein